MMRPETAKYWAKTWPELLTLLQASVDKDVPEEDNVMWDAAVGRAQSWAACALGDALGLRDRLPNAPHVLLGRCAFAVLDNQNGDDGRKLVMMGAEFTRHVFWKRIKDARKQHDEICKHVNDIPRGILDKILVDIDLLVAGKGEFHS